MVLGEVQESGVAHDGPVELVHPFAELVVSLAGRELWFDLGEEPVQRVGGGVVEVDDRRVRPCRPFFGERGGGRVVAVGVSEAFGGEASRLVAAPDEVGRQREHEPGGESAPDHLVVGEKPTQHGGLHGDRHGHQRPFEGDGFGAGVAAALAVTDHRVARPRLEVHVERGALARLALQHHVEQVGLGGDDGETFAVGGEERGDGFRCGVVGEEAGQLGDVVAGDLGLGERDLQVLGGLVAHHHGLLDLGGALLDDPCNAPGEVPVVMHGGESFGVPGAQPPAAQLLRR